MTGHQPDAVLVGAGAVFAALHQLQPGQPQPHGPGKEQHHRQQDRRLVLHAAVALVTRCQTHRAQAPSAC